ncbi:MAG: hypothetical protein ACYDGR_00835 [Candidatus Dormibacteria bacterium]
MAAAIGLGACAAAPAAPTQLVTLAAARTAVTHHWDVNRQALRATSAVRARTLIEEVESGDALKMDEATIAQEADARAAGQAAPPAIADATGVGVFVPRQVSYPAVFLSIRTQAETDAAGVPTGKTSQVLELFRRKSATDSWKNSAYADVAAGLANKLDIALDKEGYAAFAVGAPGGSELSTSYTRYLAALLAGHPEQADKRVLAGPLTDQFVTQLQQGLARTPTLNRKASFSASTQQEGIKLQTSAGGRFVLFDNLYDVVTTPAGGSCLNAGRNSSAQGSFSSVTDHFLQNVGAVVAAGSDGSLSVIAESDNPVGVDTIQCAGGPTV